LQFILLEAWSEDGKFIVLFLWLSVVWKQAKLRDMSSIVSSSVCLHFLTKVKKGKLRNKKKSIRIKIVFQMKRNIRRKTKLSKQFHSLNNFTWSHSQNKKERVQYYVRLQSWTEAIKKNRRKTFGFLSVFKFLCFLKKQNSDNSIFDVNSHQKSKNFKNTLTKVPQNWTWKDFVFFQIKDLQRHAFWYANKMRKIQFLKNVASFEVFVTFSRISPFNSPQNKTKIKDSLEFQKNKKFIVIECSFSILSWFP
jgi:hypothetical protein